MKRGGVFRDIVWCTLSSEGDKIDNKLFLSSAYRTNPVFISFLARTVRCQISIPSIAVQKERKIGNGYVVRRGKDEAEGRALSTRLVHCCFTLPVPMEREREK